MSEVILIIVSMALQIALPFWVIRRDDRKLTGEAYARGYPESTLWIAVVVFGPVSILFHFVRTRRNWVGLVLGLVWCALCIAAVAAAGAFLEIILE
ncbi:MAG: hypothetical protein ACM3ZE_07210 [Myxococcales bacterium]